MEYFFNTKGFFILFQDYLGGHLFGETWSDSSDSDSSDIFPPSYSINVRDLDVDFSKKPGDEIIDVDSLDIPETIRNAWEDELEARNSYLAYKNYQRSLARTGSRASADSDLSAISFDMPENIRKFMEGKLSSSDSKDSLSIGNGPIMRQPVGSASFTSKDRMPKPSTSATGKPEEYEIVIISDDDEEPFLDLTSTADEEQEDPNRPTIPLICDLTEDGNYDIFVNEEAGSPANISMPAPIATEKKVQDWLQTGQGQPNKSTHMAGLQQVSKIEPVVPGNVKVEQYSTSEVHSSLHQRCKVLREHQHLA